MDPSKQLPQPPPVAPPGVVPLKAEASSDKELAVRQGLGTRGQSMSLITNHFKVGLPNSDGDFYRYSLKFTYEDGQEVAEKNIGRRIMDQVQQVYGSALSNKHIAYDGEKNFFTFGSLPDNKYDLIVVLENRVPTRTGHDQSPTEGDTKRMKRQFKPKTISVEISYAGRVSVLDIARTLRGQQPEQFQEAMRILDIILRQHVAKQGCLLVRQSFFHNNPRNLTDVGGGALGCRGFYSSFKATQAGLSLNLDTSTTVVVKPGPVLDFLMDNQNVRDPYRIDWGKAKKVLKNLRIKTIHTKQEFRIIGLSKEPCNRLMFSMKEKTGLAGDSGVRKIEISVYDYYDTKANIKLRESKDLPCISVGKPKHPTYLPLELCELISLQRYTKALSSLQRASLIEKSRQKPQERRRLLEDTLRISNYNADPVLRSSGFSVTPQLIEVQGRVLTAPQLLAGDGSEIIPRNGRWNFNNKQFANPVKIENWAAVNFSAHCDTHHLCQNLIRCGQAKGVLICPPIITIDENPQDRRASGTTRVDSMFQTIMRSTESRPDFLLCILPEKKNSDLYGPWKRKCLSSDSDIGHHGVVTQCLAPTKVNDQYLTNLLLKINAKLGGINSYLKEEKIRRMPLVSEIPTLILGMDVSHGSPGRGDMPSIAAVVNSRQWPSISNYRARVRAQLARQEMIENLYAPTPDCKKDDGIIRDILLDFYETSRKRKPKNIIIFRDGVSESQFNQVLNIEFEQIMKACKHLDEKYSPRFLIVIAQKIHHTKFFQKEATENVPPGTVVDSGVCHPKYNDFYMCAHAGIIGTSRPTHYHVLLDQIGFTADGLQELVHSLSYVYQRSTTAVSQVAPICYAHLAAAQFSQFAKFDDFDASSTQDRGGVPAVPQLPKLFRNVRDSMFFC